MLLLPRSNWESKNMLTSGTNEWPLSSLAAAISTAEIRFSLPSVLGTPIGNWLPVNMTGFARLSSMKLKAEAEYAIVSVPWSTTKPSYSSYRSLISEARDCQRPGSTSEESIKGSKVYESILTAYFPSSGTSSTIWLKSNGLSVPSTGSCRIPMVPPV